MQLECTHKAKGNRREEAGRSHVIFVLACAFLAIALLHLIVSDKRLQKKFPFPLIFRQSLTFNKVLPWIFFFCLLSQGHLHEINSAESQINSFSPDDEVQNVCSNEKRAVSVLGAVKTVLQISVYTIKLS